jgi:excinuclease UvrABC helicase subunit UvrB
VTSDFDQINIYPANLFVTSKETMNEAIKEIQDDMVKQVDFLILLVNHWKLSVCKNVPNSI